AAVASPFAANLAVNVTDFAPLPLLNLHKTAKKYVCFRMANGVIVCGGFRKKQAAQRQNAGNRQRIMIVAVTAVCAYNVSKKFCQGGWGLCRLTEIPHKLI
ncbi:hypothetical protein, partial [Gemmiger formicilis]|uniref:hypothetical protein n=2 Tax=Gemmiger TaxID=204475 RepID=UPI00399B037E